MQQTDIYFETDFKLTMGADERFSTPFKFIFWTSCPKRSFIASFDGVRYTNCKLSNDGKLLVAFDNHNMGFGQLMVKMHFYVGDSDYATGICDKVVKSVPVIAVDSNNVQSTIVLSTDGASGDVKVTLASIY